MNQPMSVSVLCVSYNDICRGPMMAYAVRTFLEKRRIEGSVESAGIQKGCEGREAHPLTVEILLGRGVDVSEYKTRSIDQLRESGDFSKFNLFICPGNDKANNLLELGVKGDILVLDGELGGISSGYPSNEDWQYAECFEVILHSVERTLTQHFKEY